MDDSAPKHQFEKANRIVALLEQEYGRSVLRPTRDPLDQLVNTILSQHTSDINCARAFESLRARFPTWEEVRDAPTIDVEQSIRAGGLAKQKAPRIQRVLRIVLEDRRLNGIEHLPLTEAKERLTSLPGVGPKTAACVLLFACGLPALPVDTHVYRVAQRLGLISDRVNAGQAHTMLEQLIPAGDIYSFHLNMIRHGRQICIARHPRCEKCILAGDCCYVRRQ